VKEAQIDREIKVKRWDAFLKTMTPEQQQTVVMRLRDQLRQAEEERLDDRMGAGYDQLNKKR
jgi:hypothetical protein